MLGFGLCNRFLSLCLPILICSTSWIACFEKKKRKTPIPINEMDGPTSEHQSAKAKTPGKSVKDKSALSSSKRILTASTQNNRSSELKSSTKTGSAKKKGTSSTQRSSHSKSRTSKSVAEPSDRKRTRTSSLRDTKNSSNRLSGEKKGSKCTKSKQHSLLPRKRHSSNGDGKDARKTDERSNNKKVHRERNVEHSNSHKQKFDDKDRRKAGSSKSKKDGGYLSPSSLFYTNNGSRSSASNRKAVPTKALVNTQETSQSN